ncbi:MAG: extracellular solute-binding protein [Lachnospiraceae bacterium]|nr:extracellular solute-binding protein [Lachnospiraceae bacterium]
MNVKKRLISVLAIALVLIALCLFGSAYVREDGTELPFTVVQKETVHLWYTDAALTDYLNSKAVSFYEATDIRVEPMLVSGLEYLEAINRASVQEQEDAPDVFILTNDSLEKAYLAGLVTELENISDLANSTHYSQAAQNAVSYHGKYLGYPLYFETSALLYNKTYLEQIVAEEELSSADALIPSSIADILNFADQYSTPENVEYFFRWDVSDIFYNYFFIGNYISVGGAAGDNCEEIDIYNEDAIASLSVYQELNQFFSIDTKETNYDTIMQEFLDGKTIYTIATSDCMKKLEEARENGEFVYEYGIANIPDINAELMTKGMSVTNALVVNGYSKHKEAAGRFIEYLAKEDGNELYEKTGKLPARIQEQYANNNMVAFSQNYVKSAPIPKMVETSNFWVELEICFAKVWSGEDANAELKALSEQIKTQLAGEPVTEEVLQTPVVELLPEGEAESEE